MNCANCGGALRIVGNRNYFRCPYCETFHFPDETTDGVAVVGEASRFECPVCEGFLASAFVDGLAVSHCATCRGILADNATFGAIVRRRRSERIPTSDGAFEPFERSELLRRISCPSCRRSMDTHPYHAGGNAVIDTCHHCRVVWLDAGELTIIARYPGRSYA